MRIANIKGRLSTFVDSNIVDVEKASFGGFSSEPQAVYDRWEEFLRWGDQIGARGSGEVPPEFLGPPVPSPRQIFAIGVNYQDHAAEAGIAIPATPMVFTKFPSCIVGPSEPVPVVGEATDWEIELVVAIGRRAYHVSREDAWDYVAGVTVGQDISERRLQTAGAMPQFSLGKSYPAFGPIGPYLVTCDELSDRDDLSLSCTLDGEMMQNSRTSKMIFPVPRLIEELSKVCPLYPGDLIFTGTPSGVGHARTPARFLRAGERLVSSIDGVGKFTTSLV